MLKRRLRAFALIVMCALMVSEARVAAISRAQAPSERVLAGHLLRRTGFGPTESEVARVLERGTVAYVDEQLDPSGIDDRIASQIIATTAGSRNPSAPIYRWFLRMVFSRRQLLEKTTLFLHKHFATSAANIPSGYALLDDQVVMFRRNAFGSFRTLLANVTRDRAMLHFLNNNRNDGNARDENGVRIPPNENYAREFLQLFSMGPTKLGPDGVPVVDSEGRAVPNYSEEDVREVARALTGWSATGSPTSSVFVPKLHDSGPKTIFGVALAGRRGKAGAREVDDVVDLVMNHPSTAPFMARALILDFVTETPTPDYVRRVANVFRETDGDLHATIRAMLLDPEFTSEAVVRTQLKTPVEHVVGTYRALSITSPRALGFGIQAWAFTRNTGQRLFVPPSVFGFYAPGDKEALATTFYVFERDTVSAEIIFNVSMYVNGTFDAEAFVARRGITTPEQCVDALADALLAAELLPGVRAEVLSYMNGEVSPVKVRGAAWLIMCSPDFQVN